MFSPLFYISFFGTQQNKRSLINYCQLKLSGKSQKFKDLLRTCSFFIEFHSLLFYEVISSTGTLNEANKHNLKKKRERNSENHNQVFHKKENIKVSLCPLHMRERQGRGKHQEDKNKHKMVCIFQCSA